MIGVDFVRDFFRNRAFGQLRILYGTVHPDDQEFLKILHSPQDLDRVTRRILDELGHKGPGRPRTTQERPCKICGTSFLPKDPRRLICEDVECQEARQREYKRTSARNVRALKRKKGEADAEA